jgi:4-amino-4-deoxy-L-arabinose transferase-like glycosyltransferase
MKPQPAVAPSSPPGTAIRGEIVVSGGAGRRTWKAVWVLLAALIVLRLVLMAAWPLMDTTEARYADIARRMVAADDWITPWFDTGVPFWGKPPLSFWTTVASLRVFGFSEFAARLPHLLCMAAVVALAARLAAEHTPGTGRTVGVLLAGALVVFTASGAVMTDGPLVLGITLAACGFWRAMERPAGTAGAWRWLFFAGLAVGVLAKGPLALVLTGAAIAGWWLAAGLRPGARLLWQRLPWLGGAGLFAGLVVPWFVAAEARTPGFLHYFLVGEHVLRFLQPGWDGDRYGNAHHEAIGTIWAFAGVGWWPWTVLLSAAAVASALRRRAPAVGPVAVDPVAAGSDRRWRWFTLAWAAGPLLLFTPARNTIWMYVLPGSVGVALWAAGWMHRRLDGRWLPGVLAAGLVLTLGTITAYVFDARAHLERRSTAALLQALPPADVGGPGLSSTSGARLLFLGLRPFSASWYSGGQAERVQDVEALAARAAGLRAEATAGRPVWLAVPITQTPPALAGVSFEPHAERGAWRWWRLRPAAD